MHVHPIDKDAVFTAQSVKKRARNNDFLKQDLTGHDISSTFDKEYTLYIKKLLLGMNYPNSHKLLNKEFKSEILKSRIKVYKYYLRSNLSMAKKIFRK